MCLTFREIELFTSKISRMEISRMEISRMENVKIDILHTKHIFINFKIRYSNK